MQSLEDLQGNKPVFGFQNVSIRPVIEVPTSNSWSTNNEFTHAIDMQLLVYQTPRTGASVTEKYAGYPPMGEKYILEVNIDKAGNCTGSWDEFDIVSYVDAP